jgi:hypothetical protein
VVLQTLVFNNTQIYLFLLSVPEQKLDFFTPYMAVLFDKTCPYKITDRKIIKVEHNIIDSSRCLIIIIAKQLHFRNFSGEPKNKFSQKLL